MPAARRLRLLQEIDRRVIQAVFERAGAQQRRGERAARYAFNPSGAAIGDEDLFLFILEQFASSGAASLSWRPKCAAWDNAAPRPPKKFET